MESDERAAVSRACGRVSHALRVLLDVLRAPPLCNHKEVQHAKKLSIDLGTMVGVDWDEGSTLARVLHIATSAFAVAKRCGLASTAEEVQRAAFGLIKARITLRDVSLTPVEARIMGYDGMAAIPQLRFRSGGRSDPALKQANSMFMRSIAARWREELQRSRFSDTAEALASVAQAASAASALLREEQHAKMASVRRSLADRALEAESSFTAWKSAIAKASVKAPHIEALAQAGHLWRRAPAEVVRQLKEAGVAVPDEARASSGMLAIASGEAPPTLHTVRGQDMFNRFADAEATKALFDAVSDAAVAANEAAQERKAEAERMSTAREQAHRVEKVLMRCLRSLSDACKSCIVRFAFMVGGAEGGERAVLGGALLRALLVPISGMMRGDTTSVSVWTQCEAHVIACLDAWGSVPATVARKAARSARKHAAREVVQLGTRHVWASESVLSVQAALPVLHAVQHVYDQELQARGASDTVAYSDTETPEEPGSVEHILAASASMKDRMHVTALGASRMSTAAIHCEQRRLKAQAEVLQQWEASLLNPSAVIIQPVDIVGLVRDLCARCDGRDPDSSDTGASWETPAFELRVGDSVAAPQVGADAAQVANLRFRNIMGMSAASVSVALLPPPDRLASTTTLDRTWLSLHRLVGARCTPAEPRSDEAEGVDEGSASARSPSTFLRISVINATGAMESIAKSLRNAMPAPLSPPPSLDSLLPMHDLLSTLLQGKRLIQLAPDLSSWVWVSGMLLQVLGAGAAGLAAPSREWEAAFSRVLEAWLRCSEESRAAELLQASSYSPSEIRSMCADLLTSLVASSVGGMGSQLSSEEAVRKAMAGSQAAWLELVAAFLYHSRGSTSLCPLGCTELVAATAGKAHLPQLPGGLLWHQVRAAAKAAAQEASTAPEAAEFVNIGSCTPSTAFVEWGPVPDGPGAFTVQLRHQESGKQQFIDVYRGTETCTLLTGLEENARYSVRVRVDEKPWQVVSFFTAPSPPSPLTFSKLSRTGQLFRLEGTVVSKSTASQHCSVHVQVATVHPAPFQVDGESQRFKAREEYATIHAGRHRDICVHWIPPGTVLRLRAQHVAENGAVSRWTKPVQVCVPLLPPTLVRHVAKRDQLHLSWQHHASVLACPAEVHTEVSTAAGGGSAIVGPATESSEVAAALAEEVPSVPEYDPPDVWFPRFLHLASGAGRFFYVNLARGQSSFDPAPLSVSTAAQVIGSQARLATKGSGAPVRIQPRHSEWIMAWTGSGEGQQYYWYNTQTKARQWEAPRVPCPDGLDVCKSHAGLWAWGLRSEFARGTAAQAPAAGPDPLPEGSKPHHSSEQSTTALGHALLQCESPRPPTITASATTPAASSASTPIVQSRVRVSSDGELLAEWSGPETKCRVGLAPGVTAKVHITTIVTLGTGAQQRELHSLPCTRTLDM